MAETVKTRCLIISDTHSAPLTGATGRNAPVAPFIHPLPKADLLLHCGDLTMKGGLHEYHATLNMLKQIDAPVKLVIAGNHDLSLDRDFMFAHTNRNDESAEKETRDTIEDAKSLWTDPLGRAVKEGVTYLTEGTHQIDLPNGACVTVYASPYTPEFYDWAFPYERNEDRFNPPLRSLSDASNIAAYPVPSFTSALKPVDILLTHGPPYGRLDKTKDGDLAGCPHLLRAVMRSRPLLSVHGHIHEGSGAERITWSSEADRVTSTDSSIAEWKAGAWKSGVAQQGTQITPIVADLVTAEAQHGMFVDVSSTGHKLIPGAETLLVNASIMNVAYRPVNPPWIVNLDLPRGR